MRVLFVGNSHTYFNDMPQLFASMCECLTGERPEVTMLAYSDRSLAWHREEYFSLRFALLYGRYDFCVIQQYAHPFPGEEITRESVKRLASLCRARGVTPVIFMTWAEKGDGETAALMSRFYRSLAAEEKALLVPVGELFSRVGREHPEIGLYWKDGAHASPAGDYLTAAAFAAALCGAGDLSALPDTAMDFAVEFGGRDGFPAALEDPARAEVALDAGTARVLRAAAESAVSSPASGG